MNRALLNQIVEATLYEGYILYPYRASSKKNARGRFTFGRVYPEAYSQAQKGAESSMAQTECLVKTAGSIPILKVSARFLHPMAREIGALRRPVARLEDVGPEFDTVHELCVGGERYQGWLEAVEREVALPEMTLAENQERSLPFRFFASRELEPLRDDAGVIGLIIRRQERIDGTISVVANRLDEGLFKLSVQVLNQSALTERDLDDDDALMLRLFASTHIVLSVEGGEFVSLSDPPAELKEAVGSCKNIGVWPVLVGDEGRCERDTMLASPIILYDYPKIAPESVGSLFDGTEIDEILTLRILTMTDEEKREMRNIDRQARRLLERTETLPQDRLLRMHGTLRQPANPNLATEFDDFFGPNTKLKGVTVGGCYLQAGDRVRLRPRSRADAIDMLMEGRTAIIEAVEQDLEKRIHLAVVLESDPGKDLGLMRQPGHRFFYGVDEVEPLMEVSP